MLAMLLYVTLALALVLMLRRPARRLFGAAPAFTLWLLPPLLALLPWLPAVPSHWYEVAPIHVFPMTQAVVAKMAPGPWSLRWPCLLWVVGTSLCLLRLVFHYYRMRRQSRPVSESMLHALKTAQPDIDVRRLRLHCAGPAVLWAPRSLLLLPPDFLQCFDANQRRSVLQHETAHLGRGDALWLLLGELMLALFWFHPLAWLAWPRLRLDQELACDERVLRQSPQDEATYAHTLLHSTGMAVMPMSIPWLAQPQLKERLNMIQRPRPGALRRHFGFTALAVLITGTIFVAQAATESHPVAVQSKIQAPNIILRSSPHYPESAVKNREEGTVVLTVLVGTDGMPLRVVVDANKVAPDLIQAATDTVMHHWRFSPEMKDGKPVQSYARVPIVFKLDTPPPQPVAPPPHKPPASSDS
ncbi:MAG TPA: TonB family protein [Rhodanobacter sp.]|nr:TonB family protein [Rhodanobacter sp.]